MKEVLPHVLDDGYTRAGYIAAERGFHPELRFKWRPVLSMVQFAYLRKINRAIESDDAAAALALSVQVLSENLAEIDLKDQAGKAVKVFDAGSGKMTREAKSILGKIEPNLLRKLRDVVLGTRSIDVDPLLTEQGASHEDMVNVGDLQRRLNELQSKDEIEVQSQHPADVAERQEEADAGN